MTSPTPITQLLVRWNEGDRAALDELLPLVYAELRRVADAYLRHERSDHTLQPTALVHEAFLRLIGQTQVHWHRRAHFFGAAARLMRQILVDHARRHVAQKRGGLRHRLSLDETLDFCARPDLDLIALDDALTGLERLDSDQSRIVELRFFGGLTIEETGAALGISAATVKREWRMARAWLQREMDTSGRAVTSDDGEKLVS